MVDVDARHEEAMQQKVARLRKLLDVLVHTLKCQSNILKHHAESCELYLCHIPHCRGLKEQIRRNTRRLNSEDMLQKGRDSRLLRLFIDLLKGKAVSPVPIDFKTREMQEDNKDLVCDPFR
ncbi:hypothetical protein AgCh_017689 [Apium graveolens]